MYKRPQTSPIYLAFQSAMHYLVQQQLICPDKGCALHVCAAFVSVCVEVFFADLLEPHWCCFQFFLLTWLSFK